MGALFPLAPGAGPFVPPGLAGRAPLARLTALTAGSSRAEHLPGKSGEIPLFFIPTAGALWIGPWISLGEAGAAAGTPRALSLWFQLLWRWVGGGRSPPSSPVCKLQRRRTAAPAALLAPQAMPSPGSVSACGHEVFAPERG